MEFVWGTKRAVMANSGLDLRSAGLGLSPRDRRSLFAVACCLMHSSCTASFIRDATVGS